MNVLPCGTAARQYAARAILFQEDTRAADLYIVMKGSAELFSEHDDRYCTLAVVPAIRPLALYAVLSTAPAEGEEKQPDRHFRDAVALAVKHGGASGTIGSLAGNILGALYGEDCLPAPGLAALEAPEVVRGMADQLVKVTTGEG